MTHESMTVHQALAELKVLDSRIQRRLSRENTWLSNATAIKRSAV